MVVTRVRLPVMSATFLFFGFFWEMMSGLTRDWLLILRNFLRFLGSLLCGQDILGLRIPELFVFLRFFRMFFFWSDRTAPPLRFAFILMLLLIFLIFREVLAEFPRTICLQN